MPVSVIVAIVSLAIMICVSALTFFVVLASGGIAAGPAISAALGGLILLGMIFGQRLAWQWGRLLGILAAVIYTLLLVITIAQHPQGAGQLVGVALIVACLYTIFFALGTSAARDHFRLKCPSCRQYTSAAADFLFIKAKCRKCGEVW